MDASKLRNLVEEAYERGMAGCMEFKTQDIAELLEKYNFVQDEEYRVYTVEELKQLPDGSLFHHMSKGRCWIVSRANGQKCMQFDKYQMPVGFNSNGDPWNTPMKVIK